MRIQGLQKTTLLDYPGHVAATIFLGDCNFRCPFCHNMDIVESCDNIISEEEFFVFLKKRAGVLEGVCITGGEPTLHDELPEFIRRIKEAGSENGLLVKLDTNGTNPEMLKNLIEAKLIDYVAMDIKSSEQRYTEATGVKNTNIIDSIKQSINIVMNSDIEYEFRTTVVKQLHDEKTINGIGELIKGAKCHFIQSFKDSEYVKDHSLSAYDKDTLIHFTDIMDGYVKKAYIRGVD